MATLFEDIAITQLTKKAHNRLIQKTFVTASGYETIRLQLPNTLEQLHLAAEAIRIGTCEVFLTSNYTNFTNFLYMVKNNL